MNVFANTVVKITFKLFDGSNKLIEEAGEPIEYLHGGHSGIFPKIEEALNFKKVGESISVTLEPTDAFGDYDAEMVRVEPVASLPSDVTVGGHLVAEQDGQEVVWRGDRHRRRQGGARRQPRARRPAPALRLHGARHPSRDQGRDRAWPRARRARPSSLIEQLLERVERGLRLARR